MVQKWAQGQKRNPEVLHKTLKVLCGSFYAPYIKKNHSFIHSKEKQKMHCTLKLVLKQNIDRLVLRRSLCKRVGVIVYCVWCCSSLWATRECGARSASFLSDCTAPACLSRSAQDVALLASCQHQLFTHRVF